MNNNGQGQNNRRQNSNRPANRNYNTNQDSYNEYNQNSQPYYDENGVLHNPYDPYEQQYQQQLNEFERLSGGTDNDPDLEFHQYGENSQQGGYNNNNYNGGYANYQPQRPQQRQQGQRPAPRQNSQQRQAVQRNQPAQQRQRQPQKDYNNNSNLQFGDNNSYKKKNTAAKPSGKKGKKKMNDEVKKKHPVKTFFTVLIIIILVLVILFNLLLWRYISMVNVAEEGTRTYTAASMSDSNVRNILVIGSDTRNAEENGRTDSMILLSINKSTKEITMTSFMRDMYVHISGNTTDGESIDTWDKMNSAYVYGGAALLLDTIELNFDIAVDDYVYIDFYSFVDIVDAVGGIELEVTDEEAEGMIAPMAEQNKILGKTKGTDYLTEGGKILMNGNQALAYARLRYVGNADFERTERQRTVITKIIEKLKTSSPLTIDKFAKTCASNLTTNMSKFDMYMLSYKALFSLGYEINSLRLPDDNSYTYGTHDGQSTLDVDFDKCKQLLKDTIYG